MRRVGLVLAAGLALLAVAIGVTLSGSPLVIAGASSDRATEKLARTEGHADVVCQPGEVLPRGTSAIRLTLKAVAGPRVSVGVLSGTRELTSGVAASGWMGAAVTVPVRPIARTTAHVRICFRVSPAPENITIIGRATPPKMAAVNGSGRPLPGRIGIEYLRPGPRSWWSAAPAVARRMGLGRAPSGTWMVLLPIALMAIAIAGTSWLVVRGLR